MGGPELGMLCVNMREEIGCVSELCISSRTNESWVLAAGCWVLGATGLEEKLNESARLT